jgi:hypothetical protein
VFKLESIQVFIKYWINEIMEDWINGITQLCGSWKLSQSELTLEHINTFKKI